MDRFIRNKAKLANDFDRQAFDLENRIDTLCTNGYWLRKEFNAGVIPANEYHKLQSSISADIDQFERLKVQKIRFRDILLPEAAPVVVFGYSGSALLGLDWEI